MRFFRWFKWALFALCVAFFLANRIALALAADGPSVALPPELVSSLVDIVFLALSSLLGWAIKRGADLLHVRRESLLVERLEQGMGYALMYAREKALEKGASLTSIETRSELVAVAAGYLLPKMPAVMRELNIDAEGLRERLIGRVDLVAPVRAPGEAPAMLPSSAPL
ncbi:hypothetical protein A6A40_17245 (plasmid) [Azospirillum humicireducens]|uniref:Uncharacterized protein n=1 Tax=Azospirillum humicireducens TaxID=1226968 RepID=A0A2R4VQU5_9PROT|nr:hypothetical protein [Azospirillum humicireducens]AWB06800.1 hypothetical protein A6A40_17245 [Azospirillum humicireducens]